MQDLDKIWMFMHTIVDHNRRVHELTDTRPLRDWTSNVGKTLQQIYMVQEGTSEPLGGGGKIGPGVGKDFLEIG
jgi:hypothetical protein